MKCVSPPALSNGWKICLLALSIIGSAFSAQAQWSPPTTGVFTITVDIDGNIISPTNGIYGKFGGNHIGDGSGLTGIVAAVTAGVNSIIVPTNIVNGLYATNDGSGNVTILLDPAFYATPAKVAGAVLTNYNIVVSQMVAQARNWSTNSAVSWINANSNGVTNVTRLVGTALTGRWIDFETGEIKGPWESIQLSWGETEHLYLGGVWSTGISAVASSVIRSGLFAGPNTISNNNYGISQLGYFSPTFPTTEYTIIDEYSYGAMQRGLFDGHNIIGSAAYGASMIGRFSGIARIANGSYGAQIFGYVHDQASITNQGAGAIIIVHLDSGETAYVGSGGKGSLTVGDGINTSKHSLVVGNTTSHGEDTISSGGGFFGPAGGLTDFPSYLQRVSAFNEWVSSNGAMRLTFSNTPPARSHVMAIGTAVASPTNITFGLGNTNKFVVPGTLNP